LPDVKQPRGERFVRTCHPSTTDEETARVVRLNKGDVDGIEIRMRRGRAFTVSGTATDAAGAPLSDPHAVSLTALHTNGASSSTMTVDTGGRFSVSNVLPGDYAIEARVGGPNRPGARREAEFAFVPFRVDNADIEDLAISTAAGMNVSGRFVVDNEMAVLPKSRAPIFIIARPAGLPARLQGGTISAHPDSDLSFQFDGVFGRRTLDVLNVPTAWYVKSIRYGDTDVTDSVVNFQLSPDERSLEIVLSNRGATVSGRVNDERGDPVSKARVYLVPADRERWSMGYDYTPSGSNGSFRVGPARAGDYVVVALRPGSRQPNFQNLRDIERLLAAGDRVTLGTFEERTLDLTAVSLDR
jgi:hypothetical protein